MRWARNFLVAAAVLICADAVSAADDGAAKKTPAAEGKASSKRAPRVRWSADENNTWRWFKRETLVDGEWKLTGITTPIHKVTGQYYDGAKGYLELSAVPEELRRGAASGLVNDPKESNEPGKPDAIRKAREGRPASLWIRDRNAKELRDWLPTIDVPEAGVEGMTFWEHLTRDHGFDPAKIEGLTEDEKAKLHAAAHAGY